MLAILIKPKLKTVSKWWVPLKKYLSETQASVSIQSLGSLDENTRIKVNHGVFMDSTGTVLNGTKKKVFVKLESLGQVMIVEFPIEYLSPLC